MNFKLKWAQKIIAKEEAKKINAEEVFKKQQILWNDRKEQLQGYAKQYVEAKREEFKLSFQPLFVDNEKILTNWYMSANDTWEGSVEMLQRHTPYRGPVVVGVFAVVLDSSNLAEKLNDIIEYDIVTKDNISYEGFAEVINKRSKSWPLYPPISWAYDIRVVGDDEIYWKYTWREAKFLKLDSTEAKYSIKAWKNEVKIAKLTENKKVLTEKLFKQVEKANHTKVNYVGQLHF